MNQSSNNGPMRCIKCRRTPDQINEYIDLADESKMTPEEFVKQEEGTYNPRNNRFCCTSCYIKIGMPTEPGGWKAR